MSAKRVKRNTRQTSLSLVDEESEMDDTLLEPDYFPPQEEGLCLMQSKKMRRSISIIHSWRDIESPFTAISLEKGRKYQDSVNKLIKMQGKSERRTWKALWRTSLSSPVARSQKSSIVPRPSALFERISLTPLNKVSQARQFFERVSLTPSIFELPEILKSSVPFNALEEHAEDYINSSIASSKSVFEKTTTSSRLTSLTEDPVEKNMEFLTFESFLDGIKYFCVQNEACTFDEVFGKEKVTARKIGEGVFGEVFGLKRYNETVLKIVPAEGDLITNGEPQKTYCELFTELYISLLLSGLTKNSASVDHLACPGFVEMIKPWLIVGKYPPWLLKLWHEYDKEVGSENDVPSTFPDNQMYLAYELMNCGISMETYPFSTARQGLTVFKQVVYSLAVAEEYEFEHRDLHWGNILISQTKEKQMVFKRGSKEFILNPYGLKATIIDYTLSALTMNGQRYYTDLAKDPELFMGKGDHQFEVYRQMKSDVRNDWSEYSSKTNVRWLYYLIDKFSTQIRYQRKYTTSHISSLVKLRNIKSWISECQSALEVAVRLS